MMKLIIYSINIVLIVIMIALFYVAFESKTKIPTIIFNAKEQLSPEDHIKEKDIHVYDDRVVIDIVNPFWASFTDTNSMDPIIDEHANSIQIIPKNLEEVHLGDIISYKSDFSSGVIIHRVVFIGQDEEGTYYYLKGDNNIMRDPGRVRFNQLRRITVGIIY